MSSPYLGFADIIFMIGVEYSRFHQKHEGVAGEHGGHKGYGGVKYVGGSWFCYGGCASESLLFLKRERPIYSVDILPAVFIPRYLFDVEDNNLV